MDEVHCLADDAALIISEYDLEEMDEKNTLELVKSLNFGLIDMSRWMDLIRMIYGRYPKASPAVFNYVADYVAPIDALVDYCLQHSHRSWYMESTFKYILLLRAILMNSPEEFVEDDTTLKKLEFIAGEVGFTISFIDLNNTEYLLFHRLDHIFNITFQRPEGLLRTPVDKFEQRRPKPSRNYYPKIAQLNFVELLLRDLGELLVKAKADRSLLILEFDILQLQQELEWASRNLVDIPELRKEEADVKDIITNVANLAYEMFKSSFGYPLQL